MFRTDTLGGFDGHRGGVWSCGVEEGGSFLFFYVILSATKDLAFIRTNRSHEIFRLRCAPLKMTRKEVLRLRSGGTYTKKLSQKEKEFCYSSFPEGLELAPSRNRGLPVGHGASALATLLISSIVDEV